VVVFEIHTMCRHDVIPNRCNVWWFTLEAVKAWTKSASREQYICQIIGQSGSVCTFIILSSWTTVRALGLQKGEPFFPQVVFNRSLRMKSR